MLKGSTDLRSTIHRTHERSVGYIILVRRVQNLIIPEITLDALPASPILHYACKACEGCQDIGSYIRARAG
jgi:hypothetical protein